MKTPPIKEQDAQKAYQAIMNGGLAIIPSRVGYTLIGNSDQSIQKMFEIKGRPLTKPCVVLTTFEILPSLAQIPPTHLPLIAAINSEELLCGFILRRKDHDFFSSLPHFTDTYSQKEDGTSCFVINGGRYLEYLLLRAKENGTVIVGSSANKSGTGNEGRFSLIPENIRQSVDFAIEDDAYVSLEYDSASRSQGVMIDLTQEQPLMIRRGLYADILEQHVQKHREGFTQQSR